MELIKPIVKVGNSAGVVLPKEWLNGKAEVRLVEKPLDIKKDIFDILEPYLEDVMGIYLVGSYARGEATSRSDVDVLVITNKTSEKIEKGKYSIIIITKENVERALEDNVILILSMIKEAKPLVNKDLIKEYKKTKLTKKNLKWYIEITKSALKINKGFIDLEDEGKKIGDAVAYSLILHLRNTYIVDCLKKGILWDNKQLRNLIKKVSGSLEAYEGYLRVKENKQVRKNLPIIETKKLYNYLLKKIEEHGKWLKVKKRIEKSIESFDRLIEEHKRKILGQEDENDHLKSYWEDEIKNFEKQKEKEKRRLQRK